VNVLTHPRDLRRSQTAPYSPSDEEKAALAELDRRFAPSDPLRLRLEAQWEVNRAFVAGYQFFDVDPVSRSLVRPTASTLRWRSRLAHNLCRPYTRQEISNIGSFRPRFKSRPKTTDPEDLQAANVAEKALAHYWDFLRMPQKKWELLQSLKTTGNAFLAVGWDPHGGEMIAEPRQIMTTDGEILEVEDVEWDGEIETEVLSPFHVFVDTYATRPDDLTWWIDARPRRIEWVERHFPDKAAMVPPGIIRDGYGRDRSRWFFHRLGMFGGGDSSSGSEEWRNWCFARRLVETPSIYYPRGRLIIECNGVVLFLGDNPHPSGKRSLIWIRDELNMDGLYGQPNLDNMVPLQRTYNRVQNKEIEHVVKTANAALLEHRTNGLPDTAFITEIGERVKWNGIERPNWLAPPPLPASIPDLRSSVIADFDRVTSSFGPGRGQYSGKISGRAYLSLIEQENQNRSPVIERMVDGFTEWGTLVLEYLQRYAIEDRLIKIVGRGNQFDVVEFKGADLLGNTDVSIDVDSMQPKSKAMALELLAMLAPGERWLSAADSQDRVRVWRMLGMEDDSRLADDKSIDEREAMLENRRMLLGEAIEPPTPYQDQDVHLVTHNKMRKSDEYKNAPPIIRALIDGHCLGHYQIAMPTAGASLPPGMPQAGLVPPEETNFEGEGPPQRGAGPPPGQPAPESRGLQPFS